MKQDQISSLSPRGALSLAAIPVAALCAVALSATVLSPEHRFCDGGLGAGFPLPFLCDASSGGSPISSWGRVDFADVYLGGLVPVGFLVDLLFYLVLAWAGSAVLGRLFRKPAAPEGRSWLAVAGTGFFAAGLLCALLAVLPGFLIHDFSRRPEPTALAPLATAGPSSSDPEVFQAQESRHISLQDGQWLVGSAESFRAAEYGCGTSGPADNRPYVVFLIRGPVETEVEIAEGSWDRWANLYDLNVAMQALGSRVEEVKQRPDYGNRGYVECIISP